MRERLSFASMCRVKNRLTSHSCGFPQAVMMRRLMPHAVRIAIACILVCAWLILAWPPTGLAQETPAPEPVDILGIETLPSATSTATPLPRAATFEVTIRSESGAAGKSLTPGQAFEFRVILSWDAEDTAVLPELPQYDPPDNLEVANVATTSLSETKNGRPQSATIYTFTLRSQKAGNARMAEVRVDYKLPGDSTVRTLRTPSQSFTIQEPPKPLLSTRDLILIIGVLVLGSAGTGLVLLILRMRRKPKEEPRPSFSEETAEIFQSIRQSRLEGNHRAFCSSTAALIRQARERLPGLDEEKSRRVDSVLKACEEKKYAPNPPSATDMDRYLETVQELIQWVDDRFS